MVEISTSQVYTLERTCLPLAHPHWGGYKGGRHSLRLPDPCNTGRGEGNPDRDPDPDQDSDPDPDPDPDLDLDHDPQSTDHS